MPNNINITVGKCSILDNIDTISSNDKLEILKFAVKDAREFIEKYVNYNSLRIELSTYNVDLPQVIDSVDIGKMNILYAIAQAYHSRISTIEMLSISNCSNWKKVVNYMQSYLKDIESELLISEDVRNLPNSKIQEAFVRTKTIGIQTKLDEFIAQLEDSLSFKSLVTVKKKDISSILDNINRQVKTIKDETKRF
jgi:hypothetical protein